MPHTSAGFKRYRWQGQNRTGIKMTGVLYSADKRHVREQLALRGIVALSIQLQRESPWHKVSAKEATQFLHELSILYDSGVPLLRILEVQLHSQPRPAFREVIKTIRLDVERGENLHTALRHHPHVFSAISCNLIASGEESGRLSEVLKNIVHGQEQQQKIRAQVQTALWYPLFILASALIVWLLIMVFVVPVFEGIYRQNGQTLPWLTQALMGFSRHIRSYGWLYALFMGVGGFILVQILRSPHASVYVNRSWYQYFDALRLRLPVVGVMLSKAWHAQFTRVLAMLQQSGITLHEALPVAAQTVNNGTMRRAILAVTEEVINGQSLSMAMSHYEVFEPALIARIQIGEEAGMLASMLQQHAQHSEFALELGVKRLATLLEPMLIVVVGVMVALIVIALYLPILHLGGAIR